MPWQFCTWESTATRAFCQVKQNTAAQIDRTHVALSVPGQLQYYYLDEFTFRSNRRTSAARGLLFYRLLSQAAEYGPIPLAALVRGSSGAPIYIQ